MTKEKSFHFSLGNSSAGPIGFCGSVKAKDKKEAVRRLKKAILCFGSELDAAKATGLRSYDRDVEYIQVYFNTDAISVKDIDEVVASE